MNDFSKFGEEKFINDFSHFYTGLTSQVIIWMPTLNLVFSMFRYFNLPIIMYHVESSPKVKLSYPLNPGLPNIFLLNIQIQI